MSMWKFNTPDVETLLMERIDSKFMLPSVPDQPNLVRLFHNGDKMTVDLETGIMEWEPVEPGALGTSRLSMCLHQWFGKGIITPYTLDTEDRV